MKIWIRANEDVKAGIGSGRRITYYICDYPDRTRVEIDGYKTGGFKSEEEAQDYLDNVIYEEEYYRNKYPGLQVCSKIEYNVYHD